MWFSKHAYALPPYINKAARLIAVLMAVIPNARPSHPATPVQKVHAFPSRDGNLAVYLFGYMKQDEVPPDAAGGHAAGVFFAEAIPQDTEAGKARRAAAAAAMPAAAHASEVLEYAASVQAGEWLDNEAHAKPGPMFEPEAMMEYLSRCDPEFVQHSHPRRFCKHRVLYEVGWGGVRGRMRGREGREGCRWGRWLRW